MRRRCAVAGAALVVVLSGGDAYAWTAARQGATLTVRDAGTRANAFAVTVAPDGFVEVDDDGAALEGPAPTGCAYDTEIAVLRCDSGVTAITLDGGPGADSLTNASALTATLLGGEGPDDLAGGPGADVLDGGSGDDLLDGGDGTDALAGGDGADVLEGGGQDDSLDGGPGNDRVAGETGRNVAPGGPGADVIELTGEAGDAGHGGDGDDLLLSQTLAPAVLLGGAGSDRLEGGTAADVLDGGADDDQLSGGAGADTLRGGDGRDVLSYEEAARRSRHSGRRSR